MISDVNSIDIWLRDGGIVVTASERAARSLTADFHRARRAEGLSAWPAPSVHDWQSFVRSAWDERSLDGRMVLTAFQEQSIWARIVNDAAPDAVRLAGAGDRLATLAMEAHHLLCAYAPQWLDDRARVDWDQDAGAFSAWLAAFNAACRDGNFMSVARLPLELTHLLQTNAVQRPPLLLAGFDRTSPAQQQCFRAWNADDALREAPLGAAAAQREFHTAADRAAELAACALWAKARLAASPQARLLVVTQDASERRGEIERAFLRRGGTSKNSSGTAAGFEFSLGVPLNQIALVRGALLLLHWLVESIAENELDWLLSSGLLAAAPEEARALMAFMRALRRHGLARTRWTLDEFLRQRTGTELPDAWKARIAMVRARLQEFARQPQAAATWAEFVPHLLALAGWPGAMRGSGLTSAEFQATRRWQSALEECASLGFDGRLMTWSDFLVAIERGAGETLFAPESQEAPILIAGPAESAGLTADGLWFMGVSEDAWPASGAAHPLLPVAIQRQSRMPHASALADWDLASAMTSRLLSSAPEVHFSYSRQGEAAECRPSRIVQNVVGPPRPLPSDLLPQADFSPLLLAFDDTRQIAFRLGETAGGATLLSTQSQCPFRAFAHARLDAQPWQPAEAGLTAAERGLLLHEALHSIWGGAPHGVRSQQELQGHLDRLEDFVEFHVRRVLQQKTPVRARQCMPQRYLELEAPRLVSLLTEWLRYEAKRVPFTVLETEYDTRPAVAGLALKVRMDRVDRLNDNSLLVIDYKTGVVSPQSWELPRPEDVQLPLYATFALDVDPESVGGLAFAQIRPDKKKEFLGRVKSATDTLNSRLNKNSALVRNALTDADLLQWRACIVQLAEDFLAGRAEVDPLDPPNTCARCGLQALCRIQENPSQSDEGDEEYAEEADA